MMRGELFTTKVNLENRSYFFNVKENRNGDVFLQIVESKTKGDAEERRDVVLFADDMSDIMRGLDEALTFIEKDRKARAKLGRERKAAKAKERALEEAARIAHPAGPPLPRKPGRVQGGSKMAAS
jgi:hypothetical protein